MVIIGTNAIGETPTNARNIGLFVAFQPLRLAMGRNTYMRGERHALTDFVKTQFVIQPHTLGDAPRLLLVEHIYEPIHPLARLIELVNQRRDLRPLLAYLLVALGEVNVGVGDRREMIATVK